MPTSHEEHRIRVKAISDRLSHPIHYNDAGAPRGDSEDRIHIERMDKEALRQHRRDSRFRNMVTGGR